MKLPTNMRRLEPKDIWQEGDWFRVERGVYVILKYKNTPVVGAIIGTRLGKYAEGFRERK